MTFGEHLDELRQSLVKAIMWLAGGMIIGLFFADSVVLFVQTPLQAAIQKFNADRNSPESVEEIEKDIADGNGYGVNGTPSIFVNGYKIRTLSVQAFEQAIERAIIGVYK